jgi:phosphate transport system protein
MNHSIRATYDQELKSIQANLINMAELVGAAIERSMEALRNRDLVMAAKVIADDMQINKLRFQIEEDCLTLIATQQPIAGDLRTIVAMIHSVLELERMGDHASGIAKTVIKASDERPLKPGKKLSRMAELSRRMLEDWIETFKSRDAQRAKEIAALDGEMDMMYKDLFDRLIKIMSENPKLVSRATYLMWCGHNLERIADRVTNLAEQVIFMTTGSMEELSG